jgi:hypothetical protein
MLITQGIGEVEAMIRQADSDDGFLRAGVPGSAELARLMSAEAERGRSVSRIYRVVAAANLRSVVDGVRTALAELAGELRAGMAEGQQLPSADLASEAVQVAVHGRGHRITINNAAAAAGGSAIISAGESSQSEEGGFWTTSRRIGAVIVGLATIAGTVAAILALTH